jgi:hypothetical protein
LNLLPPLNDVDVLKISIYLPLLANLLESCSPSSDLINGITAEQLRRLIGDYAVLA